MFRFENKPSSCWKKNPIVVCQEKKFYHQRFGKIILPKQNHPYPSPPPPPQKSNGRFPIFITLDTHCLYEKKSLQMRLV